MWEQRTTEQATVVRDGSVTGWSEDDRYQWVRCDMLDPFMQHVVAAAHAGRMLGRGCAEETAIATMYKHPDWSIKYIARYIGVSRTYLHTCKEFTKVRNVQKASRKPV